MRETTLDVVDCDGDRWLIWLRLHPSGVRFWYPTPFHLARPRARDFQRFATSHHYGWKYLRPCEALIDAAFEALRAEADDPET